MANRSHRRRRERSPLKLPSPSSSQALSPPPMQATRRAADTWANKEIASTSATGEARGERGRSRYRGREKIEGEREGPGKGGEGMERVGEEEGPAHGGRREWLERVKGRAEGGEWLERGKGRHWLKAGRCWQLLRSLEPG